MSRIKEFYCADDYASDFTQPTFEILLKIVGGMNEDVTGEDLSFFEGARDSSNQLHLLGEDVNVEV